MTSQPHDAAAREAPTPADAPVELTHAQMNAAYDSGQAVPFARAVPWLVRYRDAWWVVYEGGWLRIVDQPTTQNLDERAAQMTEADIEVARSAAIRGAVGSTKAGPETSFVASEQAAESRTRRRRGMREIDDMRTRLDAATGAAETLAQAMDAFDLIRQMARQYEHHAGDWFAAYAMAAASAVQGRNVLGTAPSIPLSHAAAAAASPEWLADADAAADALAELATLLSSRLKSVAVEVSPGEREICTLAAEQADAIHALLGLEDRR